MSAKLLVAGLCASALIATPLIAAAQAMPAAPIPYTEFNAKASGHHKHRQAVNDASTQGSGDVAKAAGDEQAAVASDQAVAHDAAAEDAAAGAHKERKIAHKYAKKAEAEAKKAQDEKAKADAAQPADNAQPNGAGPVNPPQ